MSINFTDYNDKNWRQLLKEKREACGLSYEELAKILEVSKSTVLKYENGLAIPTLSNCLNIAKFLEIDVSKVFKALNSPSGKGKIINTLPCYSIEELANRKSLNYPKYTIITYNLRKNENSFDFFCIKSEKRIMLYKIKYNRFGKNENIIAQRRSKKFMIAKYIDKNIINAKTNKIVKSAHIIAQYKRDIKDYILQDNTQQYNIGG